MKISLSYVIKKDLANRATIRAKTIAPRGKHSGDHAADHLYPIVTEDDISIGIDPRYDYLLLQNRGTRSHTMTELAGKIVPLPGPGGKTRFRYVNPAKIGVPVPLRDANGITVGTKLSWTHPGLKPKHFIEKSIQEEIKAWKSTVTKEEARKILKESPEYKALIRAIKG